MVDRPKVNMFSQDYSNKVIELLLFDLSKSKLVVDN